MFFPNHSSPLIRSSPLVAYPIATLAPSYTSSPTISGFVISSPLTSIRVNFPPGIAIPMLPYFSSALSAGRYAMRAVASVCPYITTNFLPLSLAYSANFLWSSGESFPPACVIYLRLGSSILKNLSFSSISKI